MRTFKLYCDASFDRRTRIGGFAYQISYPVKMRDYRHSGQLKELSDNNEAEMIAATLTIDALKGHNLSDARIILLTDSMYVMDHIVVPDWLWSDGVKAFTTRHVKEGRGNACPNSAIQTWCDYEAKYQMRKARDLHLQYRN